MCKFPVKLSMINCYTILLIKLHCDLCFVCVCACNNNFFLLKNLHIKLCKLTRLQHYVVSKLNFFLSLRIN